jgi:hypothetical protein
MFKKKNFSARLPPSTLIFFLEEPLSPDDVAGFQPKLIAVSGRRPIRPLGEKPPTAARLTST